MKKLLITGATSSQSSTEAHKRSARFAGLLNTAISYSGNHSEIKSLSKIEDLDMLDNYDSVLIGLSPFTSMSANKIYTSLLAVDKMSSKGKVKILLDAPDPHLVFQSFKSVLSNPNILTKDLYRNRPAYHDVVSNEVVSDTVISAMEFLLNGNYEVFCPSLPYFDITKDLFGNIDANIEINSYNFDTLFSANNNINELGKSRFWVAENIVSTWSKNISNTLSKPVISVRRSQYDTEGDYIARMQESYGYLLNTHKNNVPWWSPNIMVAFSCGIPVFSDWRHTDKLGVEWSGLPYYVESYSYHQRIELSVKQKESYLNKLNPWIEESKNLTEKIF